MNVKLDSDKNCRFRRVRVVVNPYSITSSRKCIYPGPTCPLSKSSRTQLTWLIMPHRDTSVAIKTSYQFSALNVTKGHKPSFPKCYISIPNDGDNPL